MARRAFQVADEIMAWVRRGGGIRGTVIGILADWQMELTGSTDRSTFQLPDPPVIVPAATNKPLPCPWPHPHQDLRIGTGGGEFWVSCWAGENCGSGPIRSSESEAVAAWNERVR